jgi:hypothetical protein
LIRDFLSLAFPCQSTFMVNLAPSKEWRRWTQTSLKLLTNSLRSLSKLSSGNQHKEAFLDL